MEIQFIPEKSKDQLRNLAFQVILICFVNSIIFVTLLIQQENSMITTDQIKGLADRRDALRRYL